MHAQARKTAAATPAGTESAAEKPNAEPTGPEPAAAGEHAPQIPAAGEAAPVAEPASGKAPPALDKAQALANLGASAPATFHWETATGQAGSPCRECFPFGPPAGAGSAGCPHGQWVRVPDAS